jgi:hypothetical protein
MDLMVLTATAIIVAATPHVLGWPEQAQNLALSAPRFMMVLETIFGAPGSTTVIAGLLDATFHSGHPCGELYGA